VAKLSGEEWLFFLDASYGRQDFSNGAGRLMPDLSYQRDAYLEKIPDENIDELISLIRHWIKVHHARI
jgi:Ca-activated chloride channel family protein